MSSTSQQKQSFILSDLDRSDVLKFRCNIPVRKLPTTRASVTVIWLENSHRRLFIENNIRLRTLLQNDLCSVIFYSNVSKCIKYLKQARSCEYVIVIVISHATEIIHKIIYRLRQYRIIQTMYIVSSLKISIDHFSSTIDDIAIFQDKESMVDRLEPLVDDILKENFEDGLFISFNRREKALNDRQQELGAIVSNRVFKG